jgi:hypothetical protein
MNAQDATQAALRVVFAVRKAKKAKVMPGRAMPAEQLQDVKLKALGV